MPYIHIPDYLTAPTFWVFGLGCLAATAVLTPLIQRLARGAEPAGDIAEGQPRPASRMGGLAIVIPFLCACALAIAGPTNMLKLLPPEEAKLIAALAVGALAIVAVGVADDIRGIRNRYKLLAQVAVGLMICAAGGTVRLISLPVFGAIEFGPIMGAGFTVIWILCLTNILCVFEGLDGVAAVVSFIGFLALAVIAMLNGETLVVLLCISLTGSLGAFLAYHFPSARALLGSSGVLFLGFCFAGISLMGAHKTTGVLVFLAPIVVLGFPISDTMSASFSGWTRNVPFFGAAPPQSRRPRRAMGPRQIVLTLIGVAAAFLVVAIIRAKGPHEEGWLSGLAITLYASMVFAVVCIAGFLRPMKRLLESRRRDTLLQAFSRYAALNLNSESGSLGAREILEIGRQEMRLRFLEFWFEDIDGPIVSSSYPEWDDDEFAIEKIRISTAGGRDVGVRYQYDHRPDSAERRAVAECLEGMFRPLKSDIRLAEEYAAGAEPPAAESPEGFARPSTEVALGWQKMRKRISS